MSINQLCFGHQATVTISNPITGALLPLTNLVKFQSKQRSDKQTSKPLNSPPIFAHTPDGWDGNITFDRVDATVDAFFAQMETAYWNNSLTFSGTIQLSMVELSGTTTTWLYSGVSMTFEDAGDFESQKKVTQRINFEASQRTQLV